MSEKTKTFSEQIREACQDLAERQARNARKRSIAVQLRALRDAKGMTQAEVAEAAGMTQSMIARLEALSGPVPGLGSIERYVDACDGQMALLISPTVAELQNIAARFDQFCGRLPSDDRLSRDKANARGSGDRFNDGFARARGRLPGDLDLYVEPSQSPKDTET